MSEHASGVEADRIMLQEAQSRGSLSTLGAYMRLSGPGWLQSALTLGGGSLGSSLYLGILAGTSLLWLQPFAMIIGVVMAIIAVPEKPMVGIRRSPVSNDPVIAPMVLHA